MHKYRKKDHSLGIEIVIILLIGIGMIFLNLYTQNLFMRLNQAGQSAVFVMDDKTLENDQDFAERLIEYLPGTYKMIELYDENFELLFQIQFNDEFTQPEDIHNYPKLVEYLSGNQEGQTNINIDNAEQNVYFKWMDNTRGEHRLLIVYSSIESVQGIWIFHLISYIIIVLVFALLITLKIKAHKNIIREYNAMINDELNDLR